MRRSAVSFVSFCVLFLVSGAIVIVESGTVKLFRIEYVASFQYLVVTFAMAGSGLGAAAVLGTRSRWGSDRHVGRGAAWALVGSAALLLSSFARPPGTAAGFVALGVLVLGVFAALGTSVTLLFLAAGDVRKAYGFNLIGAAAGAAVLPFSLEHAGLEGTFVIVALVLVAAAVAALASSGSPRSAAGCGLAAAALVAAFPTLSEPRPLRGHSRSEQRSAFEVTRYNGFSRIDVRRDERPVEWALGSRYTGPRTRGHLFTVDGVGAGVAPYSSYVTGSETGSLGWDITALPEHAVGPSPRVLVVGAGGGKDVLEALRVARAAKVVAVEVNPLVVDVLRTRYPAAYRAAYEDPRVELRLEDVRAFLSRDTGRYDVITISTLQSQAVLSGPAAQLEQSYVYTTEAIQAYLSHLTEDGVLSVAWYRGKLLFFERVMATARELGASVEDGMFLFAGGDMAILVVAKHALAPERRAALLSAADRLGFERIHPSRGRNPVADMLSGRGPRDLDVSPVTDDRPFFNSFRRGLTRSDLGLLALLALAVAALGVLAVFRKRWTADTAGVEAFGFFAAIGAGYVAVELYLMQKLSLTIGEPLVSFTAVLTTLLLSNGVGNLLARRLGLSGTRAAGAAVVLLVAYALALRPLLARAGGLELPFRTGAAVLAIVPLGLSLGVPFPWALERAKPRQSAVPFAFVVNAVATVAGMCVAELLAPRFGYGALAALGAACYAAALGAARQSSLTPR